MLTRSWPLSFSERSTSPTRCAGSRSSPRVGRRVRAQPRRGDAHQGARPRADRPQALRRAAWRREPAPRSSVAAVHATHAVPQPRAPEPRRVRCSTRRSRARCIWRSTAASPTSPRLTSATRQPPNHRPPHRCLPSCVTGTGGRCDGGRFRRDRSLPRTSDFFAQNGCPALPIAGDAEWWSSTRKRTPDGVLLIAGRRRRSW